MPIYTFSCPCGWQGDRRTTLGVNEVACPSCDAPARRESVYRVNAGGFAVPPMSERRIPLSRAVEAQHEMVHEAARAGVQAPDAFAIAKRQAAHIRKHAPELVSGT